MAAYASRSKPISAKKMGATINTRSHFEIKWFRRVKITREMGSPSMGVTTECYFATTVMQNKQALEHDLQKSCRLFGRDPAANQRA
jgi:hypothetical protein